MPESTLRAHRRTQFFLLCAVCLIVAAGATVAARWRAEAEAGVGAGPLVAVAAGPVKLGAEPQLLFRSMARGDAFGKVAAVARGAPEGPRALSSLECERVYAARDRGVCIGARRSTFSTTYHVSFFDGELSAGPAQPLTGIPSRARVAPDGRTAAVTVFEQGDSYLEPGAFSTRTTLFDTASGTKLADLEEFAVSREGRPFRAVDFNFWGVTFAEDGNRFYATLSTAGKTYLVEGDLEARTATVLRENVECPSLSPDNRRIAYKKLVAPGRWRLHLLDLTTREDRALGETRSVDDQVEWLDDGNVAYAVRDRTDGGGGLLAERWGPASFANMVRRPTAVEATNVWTVAVAGGAPRLLIPHAYSPVVAGR